MSASTSIRINQDLYEQAKQDAALEHRSIAGQIEFWARVGRAALDNPDLPAHSGRVVGFDGRTAGAVSAFRASAAVAHDVDSPANQAIFTAIQKTT